MAALTHKDVHMEKLKENRHKVQEPPKVWHKEAVGMAMGKYPQGLLAYCAQPDTSKSHIKGTLETCPISEPYGALRETASALGTAVCRTARTVV